MTIEEEIFKKSIPDYDKLSIFGFKKEKDCYIFEKLLKNKNFKVIIKLNTQGKIESKVYDIENGDEFLPFRIKNQQGEYTGEIKAEYEAILKTIQKNCYSQKYFIYSQSNRIANKIIEKYGNYPEFLWEKYDDSAIFRNQKTKKWYAAILDVDESKLNSAKKGVVEVIDIKIAPEKIEKLLKKPNFYPAYHMNKKYWITIILNDTIKDETIMRLINESYGYSENK